MSDLKVSIVTPTYNMFDRLPRCVRSVSAQGHETIEHIVVDGGSTDGTIEYLRTQPHLRWISEADTGQSNALNKGFSMATGGVLAWLNADDWLAPGAVRLAVREFSADPDLGLLYGDIEAVSGRRRLIVKPVPKMDLIALRHGNVISQPGSFFTSAAFKAAGGIDENFHLTMDFELWLRMMILGVKSKYIPEVVAHFEIHPDSKTGSRGTMAFAEEEARALLKHGQVHNAARAIERSYLDEMLFQLEKSLRAGDHVTARRTSRQLLEDLHPVVSRTRAFLWTARLAPGFGRLLLPLRRQKRF